MNDATTMRVEGFAQGRLIVPVVFELRSAGPQDGQYDPRPRYPDGTLVGAGFKTGTNRGRPKGTGTGLGIGHSAEAKAEMVERYKAGEGLHPLAAAYSTTTQRVREIVIQAGVEIRQAGYCRKETKDEQRSDDMGKVIDIQPEQIRQIHERYMAGESLIACVAGQGLSVSTAINRFNGLGLKYPRPKVAVTGLPPRLARNTEPPHLVDLVAEAATGPGDEAMDDPTPDAAATDTRVIQVHDLTVTPQRPYTPPAIIFDGVLSELVRPQNVTTVARTVVKLVEAMNAIPGVRADFGFSYELTAGVRS